MTATEYRVGKIAVSDLATLASYRALPGWELRPDTTTVLWLKLPAEDETIFGKLPLLGRWTADAHGRLVREGRRVPEALLPTDGWHALASLLPITPPPRGAPGMPPPAVGFRLETDDAGHPAMALLCRHEVFARWAETAFAPRLQCLRFACCDDGRAFVVGHPLPAIPGTGYHRADRLWLPCGWRLPAHVWPGLLEEALRLGRNRMALLAPDGSHEALDDENLVAASRTAVRCTTTG